MPRSSTRSVSGKQTRNQTPQPAPLRIPGNPPIRNIVLITIESMSASFMQHFGYPDAITPHLDSLYKMGIAFEQCFATGNRTVRGTAKE